MKLAGQLLSKQLLHRDRGLQELELVPIIVDGMRFACSLSLLELGNVGSLLPSLLMALSTAPSVTTLHLESCYGPVEVSSFSLSTGINDEWIRGGINKKTFLFGKTLRPPPPPSPSRSLDATVFSNKEILECANPPPLPPSWQTNSEIFSFFNKISID